MNQKFRDSSIGPWSVCHVRFWHDTLFWHLATTQIPRIFHPPWPPLTPRMKTFTWSYGHAIVYKESWLPLFSILSVGLFFLWLVLCGWLSTGGACFCQHANGHRHKNRNWIGTGFITPACHGPSMRSATINDDNDNRIRVWWPSTMGGQLSVGNV